MTKILHSASAAILAAILAAFLFPFQVFALQDVEDYHDDSRGSYEESTLQMADVASECQLVISSSKDHYRVGDTVDFDFSCSNIDELINQGLNPTVQYRIQAFYRIGSDNYWVSVYDFSMTKFSDKNTWDDFILVVPGTYILKVDAMIKTNDEKKYFPSSSRKTITVVDPDGTTSIDQTVDSIVQKCLSDGCKSDFEKALWLHDWLVDYCTYKGNYLDADRMFAATMREGNCEAYHAAYARLLDKVGIHSTRIPSLDDYHTWTAVMLDNEWYQIDVTWDDDEYYIDPTRYPELKHLYFGLTDDIIKLGHPGHKANAGYESTSLADNYYIKTGTIKTWSDPYHDFIKDAIEKHETSKTIVPLNNDLPVEHKTAHAIINALVAYQLSNETWDTDDYKISLNATYEPGERNEYGKVIGVGNSFTFNLTYTEKQPNPPVTPGPVEPNPVDPTPVDPTPVTPIPDPTPVQPTPTPDPAPSSPQTITMYRLYNPNSGEHLYTSDVSEYNYLSRIGWNAEGYAWTAPASGTPVYRLYNPNSGDHHYTVDSGERNNLIRIGWNDENIGWYSGGSIPIYRVFNPNEVIGTHHYTKDVTEYRHLISIGWNDEKIGWYGM